jgi:hypothetical protein
VLGIEFSQVSAQPYRSRQDKGKHREHDDLMLPPLYLRPWIRGEEGFVLRRLRGHLGEKFPARPDNDESEGGEKRWGQISEHAYFKENHRRRAERERDRHGFRSGVQTFCMEEPQLRERSMDAILSEKG